MTIFVNLPYSQQLTATGGTAPYKFFQLDGTLPPGITLTTGGLLSGTPILLGTYNFGVFAIDGENGYGEIQYTLEVIAGNEFGDLITNNASHYWPMDEASGDYLDAIGSIDLSLSDPSYAWRQAPALGPRGVPLTYGLWSSNSSFPKPSHPTGIAIAGNLTGNFGCWITCLSLEDDMVVMAQNVNTNSGLSASFRIETNGRLRFQIDVGSNENRTFTGTGFIQLGETYFLVAEQEADGTGIKLYVNGVEAATTKNAIGTATLDWWVDELSGFTPSGLIIGAVTTTGFSKAKRMIIGAPFATVNSTFGATLIQQIYDESLTTVGPSDYHEFVQDLGMKDNSLVRWWAGHIGQNNAGMGAGVGEEDPRASGFGGTVVVNEDDNTDFISAYNRQRLFYGVPSGANTTFSDVAGETNWEPVAGKTAGSVCAVVLTPTVGVGVERLIWTHGTSGNNSMEIGIVGSGLGWSIFFRAKEGAGTVVYFVTSTIIDLTSNMFGMISVVQPGDGSGPLIYWQGNDVTDIPGTTTDPDKWIPDYGDSAGERWGGQQGSASVRPWNTDGALSAMHCFIKDLSAAQVAALWNSVKGNTAPVP